MTTLAHDRHDEILAQGPALLAYAGRLTTDEKEAHQLVELTLRAALEDESRSPADGVSTVWMFGLMRGVFHSVVRRRAMQRERGSAGRLWQPARAEAFATGLVEVSADAPG